MYKRVFGVLAIMTAAFAGYGQMAFNTLEEVWQYADTHNTAIKNAAYEVKKGEREVQRSYLDLLPDVNANAAYTDNLTIQTTLIPAVIFGGPEGVYRPVQFGQKYTYNAGFTAQLDLVNVQTWYNTRVARETKELNKAGLNNTKRNTYQQIAAQYYAYLLNKEALRLAAISAAAADSVYAAVNNRFNEGAVSLPNMDVAKLNSERAQQTLITARYQLLSSLNSLRGLLGLSVSDSISITQSLGSVSNTVSQEAFQEDPSIRLAYHQTLLNYGRYQTANAGAFPTISVLYSNNTQQFDNTFRPFDAAGPQWFPATYWSLRASWTVFNGGDRWLRSQKAKLTYLQSKEDEEQARRQAAINDDNLRLDHQKTVLLLNKAESVMNLSYDNYRHISLRYEEGLASLEDRLRAFTDYISYQNQYLNSLSEMLVRSYNIKLRQRSF
ncbi:hypothetical protein GCM10023093_01440 [Nemorincola caseinilytica]|uniref:TolC family protein n=1 Tax=Nemorincola caseinilytica TaxID=2054315 RepID=A0ABP8N4N7_9BACT